MCISVYLYMWVGCVSIYFNVDGACGWCVWMCGWCVFVCNRKLKIKMRYVKDEGYKINTITIYNV